MATAANSWNMMLDQQIEVCMNKGEEWTLRSLCYILNAFVLMFIFLIRCWPTLPAACLLALHSRHV